MIFTCKGIVSQTIKPFYENGKWGYKKGNELVIQPMYDTAFPFDLSNSIALVANKNLLKTITNPITGQEEMEFVYYYITNSNMKVKLLANQFPDSTSDFPNQEELQLNYLDSNKTFKVLFQNKIYLYNKKGKQLSSGFDNIYLSKLNFYYITEEYLKVDKKTLRIKGLINEKGKILIKNIYQYININLADSSIFCCSSGYLNKVNDDVYDLTGKIIYSSIDHISYASRSVRVTKSYSPIERFFIENVLTREIFPIIGEDFAYLNNNKGLIVNKNNWYFIDLLTGKKQKVNKDDYYHVLNILPTP